MIQPSADAASSALLESANEILTLAGPLTMLI
jgi:hypothetical protein